MATLNKTLNLLIMPDSTMSTDGGLVGGSLYRIGYRTNLDTVGVYTIVNNIGPIDSSGGVLSPAQSPPGTGPNVSVPIVINYVSGAAPKPTSLTVYVQPMCKAEADTTQRHVYNSIDLSAIVWP